MVCSDSIIISSRPPFPYNTQEDLNALLCVMVLNFELDSMNYIDSKNEVLPLDLLPSTKHVLICSLDLDG